MGTLSSNYPNSNAVEAALDRANKAEHDISVLSSTIEDLGTQITSLENNKASQSDLETLQATVEGKADESDLTELAATVSEKADATDLTALETEVAAKADTSALTTAAANLQAQIDNIITPVTQDAEVQNARVGTDGTSYQTLKARLDAENTAIHTKLDSIAEKNKNYDKVTGAIGYDTTVNLCDPNTAIDDKYVDAQYNRVGDKLVVGSNAAFAYTKIEVTNGKTYTVSRNDHNLLIVDDNNIVLQIISNGTTTVTVDSADAKYLYVSFRTANVSIDKYIIVEGSALPSEFVPHLENVRFIYPSVYAEKNDISNLDTRIESVETATDILSYERTDNLADPNTAVDNKYIGAQYDHVGNRLVEGNNTAFAYNKIEVTNGKTYTVSLNSYHLVIADENNIVLQILNQGETTITVNSPTAKYLYVSFRTATVPIDRYMIVEGNTLPIEFLPYYKNVGFKYPTKYDGIEYIVDINGSGDYTSLTECLKDLKDNTDKKTIKILSGTYDIFEEYGGAEFAAEVDVSAGWRDNSVLIPKNTHLLGIGQVILKWDPDPEDIIDDAHANLFSPINLSDDNIIIENMDIICGNGRYCIHDECGVRWEAKTANFQKITHKYINVRAMRTAKTYGNVQAYGGGSSAEGTYLFENCLFSSPLTNVWSTHANSNNVQGTGGCNFTFNNCIFDTETPSGGTVRLINESTFKNKNNVSFNGCYINGDIKVLYSGSEATADRKQTYAITALKTTVNDIIIDGEYGSSPYSPKVYT